MVSKSSCFIYRNWVVFGLNALHCQAPVMAKSFPWIMPKQRNIFALLICAVTAARLTQTCTHTWFPGQNLARHEHTHTFNTQLPCRPTSNAWSAHPFLRHDKVGLISFGLSLASAHSSSCLPVVDPQMLAPTEEWHIAAHQSSKSGRYFTYVLGYGAVHV